MAVELKTMNYGAVDVEARNVGTGAAQEMPAATEADLAAYAPEKNTALQNVATHEDDSIGRTVAQAADGQALVTTAPELPEVQGPKASVSQTLAVTNNLDALQTFVSQPLSAAMIFDLLQRAAQQAYEIAGSFNRIANKSNIDAKTSEAEHLMQQVAGEREHANTALTGAVLGAAAGAYAGMKGASLGRSDAGNAGKIAPKPDAPTVNVPQPHVAADPAHAARAAQRADGTAPAGPAGQVAAPPAGAANAPAPAANGRRAAQPGRHDAAAPGQPNPPGVQAAHPGPAKSVADSTPADELSRRDYGNGLSNMGQPISNVVTTAFDTYDKTSANGGQYQADQARIAQKNDTVNSAIAQTVVDTSKSSLDQASENIKAAQQAIQSWAERQSQVINNIANR